VAYSIRHFGVVIGDSDFERRTSERQRVGVFRPNAHGWRVFPRISGALTAARDLEAELRQRGLDDSADPQALEHVATGTAAGLRMLELGKELSGIELLAPNGEVLQIGTIARFRS